MSLRLLPLAALICALLWGSAFPAIKFVYARWEMDLPERLVFAGIRFTIAGLLVLCALRKPLAITRLKDASWRWLILMALGQTVLQYFLFYTGLAISSGVLGALLVSSGSFWWVLLSPIFHGTRAPGPRRWALLAMAALGLSLAVWKPGIASGNPVLGALCFLGATLAGILGILCLRPLNKSVDTLTATGFSLFVGGLILCACGSTAIPRMGRLLEAEIAGMTLFLAVISAAAFSLWNTLAQHFPASLLAGYRFLIPIAGVILSALFINNETPGWGIWIGGLIVITALMLLSKLPAEKSPGG